MSRLVEERELTYQERATFGTCPICYAEHGEWCDGNVGMALGLNVHGERPKNGVHLARLNAAPRDRSSACSGNCSKPDTPPSIVLPAGIRPYYHDSNSGITIYHGDCRDLLPLLEPSGMMVTDPPFGIRWKRSSNRLRTSKGHNGITGDEDTSLRDWAVGWAKGMPCAVFGSPYAPPPCGVRHIGVYVKPEDAGVVGATLGLRRDVEMIFFLGEWPNRSAFRSSVFRPAVSGNRGIDCQGWHPHSKPLNVIRDIISLVDSVGIIDPFLGAGATLVAAKQLGRSAIGIEIEERYCEIAANRLSQEVLALA